LKRTREMSNESIMQFQLQLANESWKSVCIRGPFARFVDSPYYSESELCEGAVTVSFSKYLP
jgi:hypothetical protein